MHRLTHPVVTSEREGKVADAATYLRTRQVLLDPFHRTDKGQAIPIVLLHTGSDCQDIGIENNILRVEAHPLRQQVIGSFTDRDLPLKGICLPLLIKSHNDCSSTQLLDTCRMAQKQLLSLFQRDRIDNALALYAHQSLLDHLPLGRVDHDRYTSNIWLRRDQIQEMSHLLHRIQHAIVHIDIEHLCPIFHLLASNGQRLLIVSFFNQTQELT